MNPALLREVETILEERPAPGKLKCAGPLEVASRMLCAATTQQMNATTVVGVLGYDDVDALHTLVSDISEEFGLHATVKIRQGSFSVRLSRSAPYAAAQ